MRAVIVDIRKNTAAMLSDDGSIIKVRNRNYSIGQEVDAGMTTKIMSIKATIALAAASLLFSIGLGTSSYYLPTKYVSMDINPSVEYSVNMFNRVIDAEGVNEDGIRLLEQLNIKDLKNKRIEEALNMTIEEAVVEGYLSGEDAGVMISTAAQNSNNAIELAAKLQESVKAAVEKNNSSAIVYGEAVGLERVEEARELGVTPGKLVLVEKLIESSDDPENINKQEWLEMSVKDIVAKTNENKGNNKPEDTPGKPEETPGQDNKPEDTPGKPEETPGQENKPEDTPGKPEETPEQENKPEDTPGKPEETPGQENKPEDTPGKPEETPGQENKPEDTPGKPEETPGQENKPKEIPDVEDQEDEQEIEETEEEIESEEDEDMSESGKPDNTPGGPEDTPGQSKPGK